MKHALSLIALVAAVPAFAEETRQLDAHEHGVGALNIAIEGATVLMEFHAPGADIVGFEYAAKSDDDVAAIEAALMKLGAPLDLFVMPSAAGCTLVEAQVSLDSEDEHGEEHHDDHDDHAGEDHEEHDDDGHDDHAHDTHTDEDHDEHAKDAGHTEFHAEYTLSCNTPDALNEISFAYFAAFPNAQEVEVQIITASGAQAFEVERAAPVLDMGR